jgi:Tat protein translocase TatB subunit
MDILGIGFPELLFIFIIALMVFGPRRLPEIAGKVGKFVRDLRNMSQGFMAEWQREITVAARLEEIQEVRKELEETKQALTQSRTDIATEAAQIGKTANTVVGNNINPPPTPYIKPMPSASATTGMEKSADTLDSATATEAPPAPAEETETQKNGINPVNKPEATPAPVSPTETAE